MDLTGSYTLKGKDTTQIDFMCITMIDPATSWFETLELPISQQELDIPMDTKGQHGKGKHIHSKQPYFDKMSATVGILINMTWFSITHVVNTLSMTTEVNSNFTSRPSVNHMV